MLLTTLIKSTVLAILVLVAVESYREGGLTVHVELQGLNTLADYANNTNIEHRAEM